MKRISSKLIVSLFFILSLSYYNVLLANTKESRIQVATFSFLAPISFMGSSQPEGFDLDLIKAIAEKENMNISIINYPFYAMANGLNSNDIDLVISGVFYTPERSKLFELSKTYNLGKDTILYINPNLNIESDEDLKTLKIAALEHSIQARDLVNEIGLPPQNVIPVKTAYLGYRAMMIGEVDAVINYDLVVHHLVKKKPGNYKFYTIQSIPPRKMVTIAKKGNHDMIAMFNHGLQKLQEDGTYNRLYQKWFNKNPPSLN